MTQMIQYVIPAAGAGTRFSKVGVTTPKPLIPILGIPMICWVLANLEVKELDQVFILKRSTHDYGSIRNTWLKRFSKQIHFIDVDELTEGPAITASHASKFLDPEKKLIIANSDQFVSHGLDEFYKLFRNSQDLNLILTMNASSDKWSYVARDRNELVYDVKEKIEISDEATVGIYSWCRAGFFLRSLERMIAVNDRVNGEFYVAPTYNYLISEHIKVGAYNIGRIEDKVFGLGTPEDLTKFLENDFVHQFREDVLSFLAY